MSTSKFPDYKKLRIGLFSASMVDMNRRNFLGSLVGVPLLGMFNQSKLQAEEIVQESHDIFEIMSPVEIRNNWGDDRYVDMPVFTRNGQRYLVKTWKLKTIVTRDNLFKKTKETKATAFYSVRNEIFRRRITHIHYVGINPYVMVNPYGVFFYTTYVRGATVKA